MVGDVVVFGETTTTLAMCVHTAVNVSVFGKLSRTLFEKIKCVILMFEKTLHKLIYKYLF